MSCSRLLKVLKSPHTVALAITLGALCGLYSPQATAWLTPCSALFFALLKMCALPIVVTAVLLSFARVWEREGASQHLVRIALVFLGGVVPAGLFGLVVGMGLGNYLVGDSQAFAAISEMIGSVEQSAAGAKSNGLFPMLVGMIPLNVFRALAEGQILGILIFVVMLGLSISFNRRESYQALVLTLESLNEALFRMVHWVIYLLPLGLCAMAAQTAAGMGTGAFHVLGKLIAVIAAGCLAVFTVQLSIVRVCTGESWGALYRRLREPLLVALTSSSSLATLPSLEMALLREPGAPKWMLDLMLPIGTTFCQHATTFFFSLIGAVVAKIYGISIGPTEVVVIVFGSYLQSVASAGLPAAASLGFLASVFRPLGLPVETLEAVFLAIIPFLDPLETMVNVMGQAVSVAVVKRLTALAAERAEDESVEVTIDPNIG